jgi:2-isopropylmalate synthase
VYSSIPARLVGREQEIEVGPMSGRSNVVYWLEKRGLAATEEVVDRILLKAKGSSTVLTEAEILKLCAESESRIQNSESRR